MLRKYAGDDCMPKDTKQDLKKLYRKVSDSTMIQKGIPLLKSISNDADKAKARLTQAIQKSKDTWSHPQVAIKNLDLKGLGFKPTRLAIPLPGERLGAKSWRAGKLHAHKMGDIFLVHQDASAPNSIKGFIQHTIHDTGKALKSMRGALPPVLLSKDECD